MCMKQTRLRPIEGDRKTKGKRELSTGVDTTCLDSRWGKSDGETRMVYRSFNRGTVGHLHTFTHTHTFPFTLIIHPAPFMLAHGGRERTKEAIKK